MKQEELKKRADISIGNASFHCNSGKMASSAKLALEDAMSLYRKEDYAGAIIRAAASLKYSVGILHPDYAKVRKFEKDLFGVGLS